MMYSWRARIGVIAPIDDKVEYAFNKYAPDGVSFDSTRLWFPGPTPEGLVYLSDQLEEAAKMYRISPMTSLFGCTSAAASRATALTRSALSASKEQRLPRPDHQYRCAGGLPALG